MNAKPDPNAVRRATAKLAADHRPRQLHHEPRLSRRDEQDIADVAKLRNGQATRGELLAALARIDADVEHVKATLGRVAPGDHRGYFREIEHGIAGVKRAL